MIQNTKRKLSNLKTVEKMNINKYGFVLKDIGKHQKNVTTILLSKCNKFLFTASWDMTIRKWNL